MSHMVPLRAAHKLREFRAAQPVAFDATGAISPSPSTLDAAPQQS